MPTTAFSQLTDDWIDATLAHRPGSATSFGFHQHDEELGDRNRENIEGRVHTLRGILRRLEAIDVGALTAEEQPEHELLRRRIMWELVDIEELQSWRRSPGGYLGPIGGACNGLIIRNFAPLPERAQSLISRLRQVPRLLDQGKANLDSCPRIHVETAIEQAGGLRLLFQRDLPNALGPLDDNNLHSEFAQVQQTATDALEAFIGWMTDELLPRSDADFAYGPDHFRKLLSYVDFVDRPLDELQRRAQEDLRASQEQIRELATQVDRSATPEEVIDRISQDHPTPERLLAETSLLLEELRDFAVDRRLATMPTEVRIQVAETPTFARMTTFAACSTPGAFEGKATEAYYYVTPPDASWPPERTDAYLKFFNRYSLPGITAHEAYPGHYVHISWLHKTERRLPHFLLTTTTVEGWAHYVEQVFVEAGYGDGDPRYHIMQLREALLRLCRYLVSFGLHTEGWSYDQAVEFFEHEGFATRPIAEREARRGVMGPGYYAYTLGKHEILSLRNRLKAKQGANFDLLAFHDAFMKLPYPIPIIEGMLLQTGL